MNKKEIKRTAVRRRGTTIAAAALSIAMVGPFVHAVTPNYVVSAAASTPDQKAETNPNGTGNMYPGVNADGVYQTSVDEPRYTFKDQPIKVDGAIESGAEKGAKNAIEGYVINQRNGDLSVYPGTGGVYRAIPMEGVRIYAQWIEKDGATSPVYTTTTGEDGYYTIAMKSFVDAKGKVRKFDADSNLPEGEKIRVWAENPDTNTFKQLYGYVDGGVGPRANTYDTPGGMHWYIDSDRVENVRFAFGEKPQNEVMHDLENSVENVEYAGPTKYGQVQGKVFWNLWSSQSAFIQNLMYAYDAVDVPAKGLKVYGSYLSDYAVAQIEENAAVELGFEKIRGTGWTRDQEAALQNWIKRKIKEEGKEKWIAETTEAIVGQNGDYALQFKGTFGDKNGGRGTGGSLGNPLTRNDGTQVIFPDGSKHVAWDLKGTVAPDVNYGTFLQGELGNKAESMPKHVNWDWLFVSPQETEGTGLVSAFHTNGFLPKTRYNTDNGWFAQMQDTATNAGLVRTNYMTLYSDYNVFDVTPYDTQQNYAKPGDVAETKTSGLPTQFVDGMKYQIEWVNANTGKVVKTSEVMAANPDSTLPSFPLDTGDTELFKDGIKETTTFVANLYPVNAENNKRGERLAADAFTVLVGWQPNYEDTEGPVGKELTSDAPTFDNTATPDQEKVAAADLENKADKYELPETFTVPEGYAVDVDEATGKVSVTFPEGTKPGTELDVPVKVTYEDGTSATGSAKFVVKAPTDTQVEPTYEGKKVVPGTPVESEPSFKKQDEDGNVTDEPAEAPEGSKFAISDDFTAPEGYTVKIDENTGKVTVEADPDKLDKDTVEEFDVPVTVTYPDETTDEVKANFKLDTDGDGTPDSKDDDDDNDGIKDKEEKDKGSNPKDEGSIPATPLEPGNPTDAATLEPSYED